MFGFKNGNKEVCNGGCRQHPHPYALRLVDNDVAEAHPVVPHEERHGINNCFRVLMAEAIASLFSVEVLPDTGNTVFCIDICVHAYCVVGEDGCIRGDCDAVELLLQFN